MTNLRSVVKQVVKRTIKPMLTKSAVPALRAIVQNSPSGRLRAFAYEVGNSRLVNYVDFVTKANGIIVEGNTQDFIQRMLYWFGVWEPNITDYIRRTMREATGRVFVDVGANIGYYSVIVAKSNPTGKTISIEGFPPTVKKLRANILRNECQNVRVVELAVSDTEGTLEFFQAPGYNEGATTTIRGRYDVSGLQVPCKPLSTILTESEITSTRLIKIDVEGAEVSVVKGAVAAVARMPQDVEIIIEVSEVSPECSKFIFDTFCALGFNSYIVENDYALETYMHPSSPKPPKRLREIPSTQADIVFSRADVEVL